MSEAIGSSRTCLWFRGLPTRPGAQRTGPPTHKRRPARGQGEPGQYRRLQPELLEAIFSSTNLEAAYRRVKANDGAAGVDGVSLADFT
ncbi:hypothetical protein QEH52_20255, partial [Coraliomargarita sp. SDUM461003]